MWLEPGLIGLFYEKNHGSNPPSPPNYQIFKK